MAPPDRLDPRPLPALAIDAPRRVASASPTGSDDATGSIADDRDGAAAVGSATRYGLGHARGMASVDAASDRRPSPVDATRDTALRVAADARLQLAAGDTPPPALDSPAATPAHDRGVDALTASLGVGAASQGADPAAAPTPAPPLALATPVDAPDFASALAVRVSVLVQDGVQQAELHLNPAETGPVSIHITVDGTAARVDFGADVAATRAAIERGLPELASALRDAGFTLAGGGVSQHAGGRASGEDDPRRSTARLDGSGNPASTPIAAESRRVARAVAAGGVDLYA
jgi:flagellar hook-length control protein FliK